jgi:hypothetical protein
MRSVLTALCFYVHSLWQRAVFLAAAPMILADCGDRYDSCEATRSCPLAPDAATGGTAGSAPDSGGSLGTAGSSGGSLGAGDAADVQPDTTAPTVLSVTPSNGARGVAKHASIVVVFSEPMDQQKTEMAYESTALPATAVTFSWSADKTQLTIDCGECAAAASRGRVCDVTPDRAEAAGEHLVDLP